MDYIAPYIGRFAPSPSGPLHLGSLYAALASFLHAKASQGQWLLRIDDIDTPRVAVGATDSILHTLESHGLCWDGAIDFQSQHTEQYQSIIELLVNQGLAYPCFCNRKTLLSTSGVYPGTCRHTKLNNQPYALRINSKPITISFSDELQGSHQHLFADKYGDFIIKRKDNITAYQLAVVVDDSRQGITHVVRGYDLLDSTAKQIYLQNILGYPSPKYCHFPVIIGQDGHKLSKQTFAQAVSTTNPAATLFLLLKLLQQKPPQSLQKSTIAEILKWGIQHWQPQLLNNTHTVNS